MGYYTELHYNVELTEEGINVVEPILKYMLLEDKTLNDLNKIKLPNHPLFSTDRWKHMLLGDSYYFAAKNSSRLVIAGYIPSIHYLNVTTNFKNYNNEIQHFIDWLDPYVNADKGDFLGFYRAEDNEEPILIRKR